MQTERREGPYIKILEEPAAKVMRFRYLSEGRSAGSIPGANSTSKYKTYPTIQIVGYTGRVIVVVSCVTQDEPYRAHPHNLVGMEGCKRGICSLEIHNETMTQKFDHLGIQCAKRNMVKDSLKVREKINVDPFDAGFSHSTKPMDLNLNAVRLCFQAFIVDEPGKFRHKLEPVVSQIIFDKKSLSDLTICELSHSSAPVSGGQRMIILCEKVLKENISVRLYEERNGHVEWEGLGDFTPTQVHKQVAITFKTPRYKTLQVEAPVQVFIQLQQHGQSGDPVPFQLTPVTETSWDWFSPDMVYPVGTSLFPYQTPQTMDFSAFSSNYQEACPPRCTSGTGIATLSPSLVLLDNSLAQAPVSTAPSNSVFPLPDTSPVQPLPNSTYFHNLLSVSRMSPTLPEIPPPIPEISAEPMQNFHIDSKDYSKYMIDSTAEDNLSEDLSNLRLNYQSNQSETTAQSHESMAVSA